MYRELDKLVLNYLTVDGYKDAADAFLAETNSDNPNGKQSIDEALSARTRLRQLILTGDPASAISLLADTCPDLLDTHPLLPALLHLQCLIEAVRDTSRDVEAVITMAREQVAPLLLLARERATTKEQAAEAEELVKDCCRAVGLLLIPSAGTGDCVEGRCPREVAAVVGKERRGRVANAVNRAVLEAGGVEGEAVLPRLLALSRDQ
jgi:hypothetical protein